MIDWRDSTDFGVFVEHFAFQSHSPQQKRMHFHAQTIMAIQSFVLASKFVQ